MLRLVIALVGGGVVVAFSVAALAPRVSDIFTANTSTALEVSLDELA
ncbi:MAG: hypothetical protein GWM91_05865, partial [Actinobacteria bacterium]|nr:hypothetical protein [Actinomycetota bacterium]NIV55146.1 hypothetical protein [Actinomycetota bacterium]NIX49978.1 hypothetical protein [Actinomycetota bacterium]